MKAQNWVVREREAFLKQGVGRASLGLPRYLREPRVVSKPPDSIRGGASPQKEPQEHEVAL